MKTNLKTTLTVILMAFIMHSSISLASQPIITKSFTGGWYDPAKNGQGFLLEIINSNGQKKALTTWFTFDTTGNQMWLIGVGEINNQNINFDMYWPNGGLFGDQHDPNNISNTSWGTVTFSFTSCNQGTATWVPQLNVNGFNHGTMPIIRNTVINNLNCTGGLFDELADTVTHSETRTALTSTGEDADASGHIKYEQRADRIEFSVEAEGLPIGQYDLLVGNAIKGSINVINVVGGTEGEIEFRDPVEPGKVLLDFDPRGQTIDVSRSGVVYLTNDEFNTGGNNSGGSTNAPPFGDSRIETRFTNTGVYPLGYAKAELRQRNDRVDFKIELEDVPTGFYDFSVNGEISGIVEVRDTAIGIQGELEFRNPVEPGKVLLDFNPLGQLLELSQGSTVMFTHVFQANGSGGNDDDDDDNGNGSGSGDDDCDDSSSNNDGDCDDNGGENCPAGGCQVFTPLEIEVDFNNHGVDSNASGDIDYRVRSDRADLKVEVEDLDLGTYQLVVGGQEITSFAVNSDETELEFRNPVEPGKLDLDFDPLNKLFEIKRGGTVYMSATLQ